jgi:hypothetical protein
VGRSKILDSASWPLILPNSSLQMGVALNRKSDHLQLGVAHCLIDPFNSTTQSRNWLLRSERTLGKCLLDLQIFSLNFSRVVRSRRPAQRRDPCQLIRCHRHEGNRAAARGYRQCTQIRIQSSAAGRAKIWKNPRHLQRIPIR